MRVQEIQRGVLQGLLNHFAGSADALTIWNAIKICTEHDIPFPVWVSEYLKKTSYDICSIKDGQDIEHKIYKAIGIDGNSVKKNRTGELKDNIYRTINSFLEYGVNKTVAIEKATEIFFLSTETVKKYYYEVLKIEKGDDYE